MGGTLTLDDKLDLVCSDTTAGKGGVAAGVGIHMNGKLIVGRGHSDELGKALETLCRQDSSVGL